MRCHSCQVEKLSAEFPSSTICKSCNHAPSFCLSCAFKSLEARRFCPECEEPCGDEDFLRLKESLIFVRNPYYDDVPTVVDGTAGLGTEPLHVCSIQGHSEDIPVKPGMTVAELRVQIAKICHVEVQRQRILFRGNEISGDGPIEALGVVPGSTLHLIVMLYNITSSSNIKDVRFDLCWGYPTNATPANLDFLDGSCLLYSKNKRFAIADYQNNTLESNSMDSALLHSGDSVDHATRTGQHTIFLRLDKLSPSVDKAFFILSSFKSPDISHYPNPSVRLYEESRPDEQLCEYSIPSAGPVKAVVMCAMYKTEGGGWMVEAIGRRSGGNVLNYPQIEATITDIIKNMSERQAARA